MVISNSVDFCFFGVCMAGNRYEVGSQSRVLLADLGNSGVCLPEQRDHGHARAAHLGEDIVLQQCTLQKH